MKKAKSGCLLGMIVAAVIFTLPVFAAREPRFEVTESAEGTQIKLSESDLGLYTGIAEWIYRSKNDGDEIPEMHITADDLTSDEKAFLTYYYQYHCSTDGRIYSEGEYNGAYILDMQLIMSELFENVTDQDFAAFENGYVERRDGELYLMNATGDFGDAGSYYFADAAVRQSNGEMLALVGNIRVYDPNANDYFFGDSFTAYYRLRKDDYSDWLTFVCLQTGPYDEEACARILNDPESILDSGSDVYAYDGYDGTETELDNVNAETLDYLSVLALDYYERNYSYRPGFADVEPQEDGMFLIHLYDIIDDENGGHTATSAWYRTDYTGYGTDEILGGEVNLLN